MVRRTPPTSPPDRKVLSGAALHLAAAVATIVTTQAASAREQLTIAQYRHTKWTAEEGAPAFVTGLAVDRDGFLWIGSADGLFRYDGITFEHVPFPDGSRMAFARVLVTRSGRVWVASSTPPGGLAYVSDGALRSVPWSDPAPIAKIQEGPDGTIWMAATDPTRPLWRVSGGHVAQADRKLGFDKAWVGSIVRGSEGGLWLAQAGKLSYLAPGQQRFRVMPENISTFGGLVEDDAGDLWYSGREGTFLVRKAGAPFSVPAERHFIPAPPLMRGAFPLLDRATGLWIAGWTGGLRRIPTRSLARSDGEASIDRYQAVDGLSSDIVFFVTKDREGNIWTGGEQGLDRFRATPIVRAMGIEETSTGYRIASADRGRVYIASNSTVYRVEPGASPRPFLHSDKPIEAICASRSGTSLTIVDEGGVRRLSGLGLEKVERWRKPKGAWACLEGDDGTTWIAFDDGRLEGRGTDGKVIQPVPPSSGTTPFTELVASPAGMPVLKWGERLFTVRRNGGASVTAASSLGVGIVGGVTNTAGTFFASGREGLARWTPSGLQRIASMRLPWSRARSMLTTSDGFTWVLSSNALFRIRSSDLDHAFVDGRAPIPVRSFGIDDGLTGREQHATWRGAQLAQGGDGRLWILTSTGVLHLDPSDLKPNRLAPAVVILALTAAGRRHISPRSVELPVGARDVAIAYTAPSLSVPSRVRFQYRLFGRDGGWTDAGSRREAFFTNLPPGRYRFQVRASNDDGVWNDTGASLELGIPAKFNERTWFKALLAGLGLLVLWGAHVLRLRRHAAKARLRMEERLSERERIAREIHDTILQGFQGVVLVFQGLSYKLAADHPARFDLDRAVDRAQIALNSGRDRIRDLRTSLDRSDLAEDLSRSAGSLAKSDAPAIRVASEHEPRELQAAILDDVRAIVDEAMWNAVRHSGAREIDVMIRYEERALVVSVRDDGSGFDQKAIAGTRFGVVGMRERAARIGGDLTIESRQGTQVTLSVPAARAYVGLEGFWRRLARRLAPKGAGAG